MSHILARLLLVLVFLLAGCFSAGEENETPQKKTPGTVALNYILGASFLDREKIEFAFGKEVTDKLLWPELSKVAKRLTKNKFPAVIRRAGTDLADIQVEEVETFEDAMALVLIRYKPVSAFVLRKEDLRNVLMQIQDRKEAHQTAMAYIRNQHGSVDQVRKERFFIVSLYNVKGRWHPILKETLSSYTLHDQASLRKKAEAPDWDTRLNKFMDQTVEEYNSKMGFLAAEIPWCSKFFCDGLLDLSSQAFADLGKY